MMIFVVAGNTRQYHDYLREARLSPEAARYVVSADMLYEQADPETDMVIWAYGWTHRPDAARLEAVVDGRFTHLRAA
jgi:hypothetical protein